MSSVNRHTGARLLLGALLLSFHGDGASVWAQSGRIQNIGEFAVGTPLKQVMHLRRENCQIEPDQKEADCNFINRDGVQYVVLGKTVDSVIVNSDRVKRRIPLPFGLLLGEPLSESIKKLLASEQAKWTIFRAADGSSDVAMLSVGEYSSTAGARFPVQLLFKNDKLFEIRYNVGSV